MMSSLDNLDAGVVKACQRFQTLLKDDILGATLTVREAFSEELNTKTGFQMFSINTDEKPVQSFPTP